MTSYRSQAHRRPVRLPVYAVQLALLVASAAVVLAAGWWLLSAFLSFGTYIESVLP